MARSEHTRDRPLIATSLALLVLALLPTRLLVPWVNDLAAIVQLPLAPLGHLNVDLAQRLRPGPDPHAGSSEAERRLIEERDAARAMLRAEQARVEELREQIIDLSLAASMQATGTFDLIHAEVIGRVPGRRDGPLRLNVGQRSGVRAGAVAVHRGGHLIGRIAEDVGRLTSLLVPITDVSVGRVRGAVIVDADGELGAPELRTPPVRILLTPADDGSLIADVDADAGVEIGHPVVLDDPAWSSGGRGMVIGLVESMQRRDDQPLRQRIVVRPVYDAQHIGSVVIKVDRPGARSQRGNGGSPLRGSGGEDRR